MVSPPPTRPAYVVAVGFLSALALPLILNVICVFVLLYIPRGRFKINTLLRFASVLTSCECWRNIDYFWEGTVFESEYCPPSLKLSRLLCSETFRTFYDGGHYSLRGDIIHSDNGTPPPVYESIRGSLYSYFR